MSRISTPAAETAHDDGTLQAPPPFYPPRAIRPIPVSPNKSMGRWATRF